MSKSKGNVIDPLELIEQYGADALRFTLAAMAAQGRDIKLSIQRVEGYRNFATKIWNAARFAEMNGCAPHAGFDPRGAKETLNRWTLGECAKAVDEVTEAIVLYKFNEAAGAAYRFVWNVFCDWYLELAKPVLQGAGRRREGRDPGHGRLRPRRDLQAAAPLHAVPDRGAVGERGRGRPTRMLALAPWPKLDGLADEAAEAEIGWVVELISEIRSARSEMNVPRRRADPARRSSRPPRRRRRASSAGTRPSAGLRACPDITFADAAPRSSVQLIVRGETAALPLEGIVDLTAEIARLARSATSLRPRSPRSTQSSRTPISWPARAGRGRRGAARAPRGGRGAPRQDRGGAGAAEGRYDGAGLR